MPTYRNILTPAQKEHGRRVYADLLASDFAEYGHDEVLHDPGLPQAADYVGQADQWPRDRRLLRRAVQAVETLKTAKAAKAEAKAAAAAIQELEREKSAFLQTWSPKAGAAQAKAREASAKLSNIEMAEKAIEQAKANKCVAQAFENLKTKVSEKECPDGPAPDRRP